MKTLSQSKSKKTQNKTKQNKTNKQKKNKKKTNVYDFLQISLSGFDNMKLLPILHDSLFSFWKKRNSAKPATKYRQTSIRVVEQKLSHAGDLPQYQHNVFLACVPCLL